MIIIIIIITIIIIIIIIIIIHDNVAKYLHWLLCGKYDIQREHYWWRHSPYSVVENNSVKLLWDFNIFVDQ